MSFLSNLFTRREKRHAVKTVSITSEIEKVIDNQEKEQISEPEPTKKDVEKEPEITAEEALAAWVLDLNLSGKFAKDYQSVHNFLVNTDAEKSGLRGLVGGMHGISEGDYTEEMRIFIKSYKFRKCKCFDEDFQSWITSVKL